MGDELDAHGGSTTFSLRARLAAAAFGRTAAYDAAIASWMSRRDTVAADDAGLFPDPLVIRLDRLAKLRYGENPHQTAALYAIPGSNEAKRCRGTSTSWQRTEFQ